MLRRPANGDTVQPGWVGALWHEAAGSQPPQQVEFHNDVRRARYATSGRKTLVPRPQLDWLARGRGRVTKWRWCQRKQSPELARVARPRESARDLPAAHSNDRARRRPVAM